MKYLFLLTLLSCATKSPKLCTVYKEEYYDHYHIQSWTQEPCNSIKKEITNE